MFYSKRLQTAVRDRQTLLAELSEPQNVKILT